MYSGKKILALITARGGSKGIPKKNIIDLGGKPLIAWTIEAAKKSKYIDRLILSSEDNSIIKVASEYGCEIPFVRPENLAEDETSSMDVITHALEAINENYDYLLLLQPTSPFRTSMHIDEIIERCIDSNHLMMVSVSKAKKHPDYMYYRNPDYSLSPILNYSVQCRRQDKQPVFEYNGALYLSDINFLKNVKTYNCPQVISYEMTGYSNIDIDEPEDLEYANYIAKEKL